MRAKHRSLDDWLEDIATCCDKIVAHTSAISYQQFLADEPVRDLVARKVENMGEAAKNIDSGFPAFTPEHPSVPWRRMAQMRDRLTHGYHDVSTLALWETARNDIPPLREAIAAIRHARARTAAPSSSTSQGKMDGGDGRG